MKQKNSVFTSLLTAFLLLDVLALTWWVFLGTGAQMAKRLAATEERLETLIEREGYTSDLGEEVLVNKAAAEAVRNLKPELVAMQQKAEPTPIEDVLGITDETREYFVPMGTGSTNKTDWIDVPSVQATINGDRYGQVVAVYFEASMKSSNGKVEARLLDRTNATVIHESNVEHVGDYTWIISKPFSLPTGGRTFVVQMRSSSGDTVELNGARLRIVTTQK